MFSRAEVNRDPVLLVERMLPALHRAQQFSVRTEAFGQAQERRVESLQALQRHSGLDPPRGARGRRRGQRFGQIFRAYGVKRSLQFLHLVR